jgi:thiamine kinase-like enzyme
MLQVPGQDDCVSQSTPFSITAGSTLQGHPLPPTGVWDQGCYWHLDTRQQEFQSIPRSWSQLRGVADQVDAVLKGQRADGSETNCHQTLVHGDFKSANLLWNGGKCCAYDFQYVGKGLGVRDLAYMFASAVDIDVLEADGGEEQLLRHYHSALQGELHRHGKADAAQRYSYEVMVAQFEACVVDYVRFMAGWGMWGNAEWASERAREVLGRLDKVVAVARTGW